jgi:hypothetical protein
MLHRSLAVAALTAASLLAQEPTKPSADAAAKPPAPALPAVGSPEAQALLDQAIAKMKAYGRGAFATTESSDLAMLRAARLPVGPEDVEVRGGWEREVVWADADGKDYVKANGRTVAKAEGGWKLRGDKLPGGQPAPFTLDPDLLFTVLAELPAADRKVAHVEAGEVAGKPVALLSLVIDGDAARDLAESGALPVADGPGGRMLVFGGMGGMGAPEHDYSVHLALSVDPAGGDVLRFHAKVFDKNPMAGNVQIQIAGGPGGDGDDEDEVVAEEKKTGAAAGDAPQWKKGFQVKKPAKDETVTTYRVDFSKLGLAEPPALDDKAKALLRLK